jgi:hypothetical protein
MEGRRRIHAAVGVSCSMITGCKDRTMRKHTVKIHGHHCEIRVYREGKHVWFAVGDYLGEEIKVQAESEGAAVKRWRERASTMGN